MKKHIYQFIICLSLLGGFYPKSEAKSHMIKNVKPLISGDCETSKSQTELNINNVRAKLLAGGDMWWDKELGKGGYFVLKAGSKQTNTALFYSTSLWFGGKDATGNFKIAAGTFRSSGIDFWPGPLDENDGTTQKSTCNQWDRHFEVYGKEIQQHQKAYQIAKSSGKPYEITAISDNIKYWPAKGNPYFKNKYSFDLPVTNQGLAPFFDENSDDKYDPIDGDYPILENRSNNYADQMIFWITNDNGNIHTNSNFSEPIGLEIQNMAYAFLSDDEAINNASFYNQRIINRKSILTNSYVALWSDPDLGCSLDDKIGYDTLRNLMYVYNGDALDGYSDCTCNTTATFCNDIPMVGIDMLYHSNLLIISDTMNHTGDTLSDGKLTSFTYYTNPQENWNGNDDAPYLIDHFYNYISGKWRNGEKYTKGSIAYNTQSTEYVNFVFTGEPCKPKEWSLANLTFSGFDIRSIQSIGPFDTYPGQVIDLTYSVVYAPNIQYPNPCLDEIRAVDDKIQQFFDRNFNFKNNFDKGPDAPTLKISPNILSINFTFINDLISNNFNLKYKSSLVNNEIVNQDSFFRFEGYRVYQILDTNLLFKDLYTLTNTNSVKEVFQADISNQIKDIFAYKPSYGTALNPTTWNKSSYILNANNQGIPDKFELTTDAFTGHRFENGKTYYFTAIAYAYNNYMDFNELIGKGQSKQFLEGSRNKKIYKVIIPKSLNNIQNPIVTRLEGVGNGGNYLQVLPTMKDSILKYNHYSQLKYPSFNSPVKLLILDPKKSEDKQFQLTIIDDNLSDTIIADGATWKLTDLQNLTEIISKNSIQDFNEELIDKYGFLLSMNQLPEPGEKPSLNSNSFVGSFTSYNSYPFNWYEAVGNGFVNSANGKITNNFLALFNKKDTIYDKNLSFFKDNNFFYPYSLMDYYGLKYNNYLFPKIISSWQFDTVYAPVSRAPLSNLNNVDIVFTPDKTKWSRCVIVETANRFFTQKPISNNLSTFFFMGLETKPNPDGKFPSQFELRGDFSVGKNDQNGDGKPDPDGELDVNGKPLYGMGWFPGYAVDIETGKRLNIYFGENSCFSEKYDSICKKENQIGGDMLWNPNGTLFTGDTLPKGNAYNYFAGGQHFIYVTNQTYDSCELLRDAFSSNVKAKVASALKSTTWTSIPLPLKELKPLGAESKGLIPSECVIKLRVNNAYQVKNENGINNGYPTYLLDFKNRPIVADNFKTEFVSNNLSNVLIHPNPYFPSKHSTLNMSNLPENSQIEIYNLSGNLLLSQKASKQFSWDHKLQNGNLLNTSILLIKITNLDDKSYEIKKVMVE